MQTSIEESIHAVTDTQQTPQDVNGLTQPICDTYTTGSNDDDDDDDDDDSSHCRETKLSISLLLSLHNSNTNQFPILDDDVFQRILSFVGKNQFRFVGSVNRRFRNTYLSLYPRKYTYLTASTLELLVYCLEDLNANCACNTKASDELCLRWKLAAEQQVWPFSSATTERLRLLWCSTARHGNSTAIMYLWEIWRPFQPKFSWRYDIGPIAAKYGQMEFLRWAYSHRFYIKRRDKYVCQYAIGSGHFDIFNWAKEHGFRWDKKELSHYRPAAVMALEKGKFEVLKWLHRKGYNLAGSGICINAAQGGHLEILQWLRNIGCIWNNDVFFGAIKGNSVEVVEYMMDNGFENVYGIGRAAARYGCMDVLDFLYSLNYEFEHDEINYAAAGGQLDIIKWAMDHGHCLTTQTSYYAAYNDQLTTLKWLFSIGCPWDETTTTYAATEDIYLFAKSNGCPIATGDPRKKVWKLGSFCSSYFRES